MNCSKLHLNKRGTNLLSDKFAESIPNSLQRHLILYSPTNRNNCNEVCAKSKVRDKSNMNFIGNLKVLQRRNINRFVIGQINIISLIKKIDSLTEQIYGIADVLMILETKLDDSFPAGKFLARRYFQHLMR